MLKTKQIILLAITLLLGLHTNGKVYHVKNGGGGDGTTWATAIGSIDEAIDKSKVGDEIWIASGIYKPTKLLKSNKKKSRSFIIKDGVSLYGGFKGNETSKQQRERKKDGNPYDYLNETILSSDDGVEDKWERTFQDASTYRYAWKTRNEQIPGTENNYCHVLFCQEKILNKTIIDGLTLKGANAQEYKVKAAGGALYAIGNIQLTTCKIVENSSWFKNESTKSSDTNGGAVYIDGTEGALIKDCYFARNYAHSSYGNANGGAIYAKGTIIENCYFEDCVGLDFGGAVYAIGGKINNCEFTTCYGAAGGAIYSTGTIQNNIIYNCRGLKGGGIYNVGNAYNNIVFNCYADLKELGDNSGGLGGGIYVADGKVIGALVFNCQSFRGGGIMLVKGNVINCTLQNNKLRAESDTANIGFDNYDICIKNIKNTIFSSKVNPTNFKNPTKFIGFSTDKKNISDMYNSDWKLSKNSEFIDKGEIIDDLPITKDLVGNKRIVGKSIDIGAYEYSEDVIAETPSIIINYAEPNQEVTIGTGGSKGFVYKIDNGSGNLQEYNSAKMITTSLVGKTLKIYGDKVLLLIARQQGIESIDISRALDLSRIQIDGNNLKTLDISNNKYLTGVYCADNEISELNIENNRFLRVIDCHNNNIKGTLDCSIQNKLSKIDCADNYIEKLLLPHHENLVTVDCSRNNLSELDLHGLTKLNELSCSENNIKSLDFQDLVSVAELYAFKNKIDKVDISKMVKLRSINLANNYLTDIDLSKNTELEGLYLYDNQLANIDITNSKALRYLNIYNNKISNLNTKENTLLSLFIANKNNISEIDLSNNTNIVQLQLGSNKLKSIDVTKLKNLYWLKVDENNINTIDISNNTYLTWLECGKNNLTNLSLSNNKNLQRIEANDNKLSKLDLTNNKLVQGIMLQGNIMKQSDIENLITQLGDVRKVVVNSNNETWIKQLNVSKMEGISQTYIDKAKSLGWIVTAEIADYIQDVKNNQTINNRLNRIYYTIDGKYLGTIEPKISGAYIMRLTDGTKTVKVEKLFVK